MRASGGKKPREEQVSSRRGHQCESFLSLFIVSELEYRL